MAATFSCPVLGQKPPRTPGCERLAKLALPKIQITSAQMVMAGAFTPPKTLSPWLRGEPGFFKKMPPFWRVTVRKRGRVRGRGAKE